MQSSLLNRRTALAGLALLASAGTFAQSGEWPARQPIRLVIPGPPGGAMDIYARLIQVPLQNALNQTLVLDFKPGANSIIGIDAVAKAAPDGYTLVMAPSSAIAINPIILPKMPFDVKKDLVPVAQMGAAGILLVSNPTTGFKNLQDMVAYAKANPGKLAYGSWGNGSTGHLVMEGIKAHYGLDMPHIPYKTTAQEITDLLGNTLSVAFTDIASPVPHIRSGKLVALGATGSARGPALPDLQTVSEQGFKFDSDGWFGIFAPAGSPKAATARINAVLNEGLRVPELVKLLQAQGAEPVGGSAADFERVVRADFAKWGKVVKESGARVD